MATRPPAPRQAHRKPVIVKQKVMSDVSVTNYLDDRYLGNMDITMPTIVVSSEVICENVWKLLEWEFLKAKCHC